VQRRERRAKYDPTGAVLTASIAAGSRLAAERSDDSVATDGICSARSRLLADEIPRAEQVSPVDGGRLSRYDSLRRPVTDLEIHSGELSLAHVPCQMCSGEEHCSTALAVPLAHFVPDFHRHEPRILVLAAALVAVLGASRMRSCPVPKSAYAYWADSHAAQRGALAGRGFWFQRLAVSRRKRGDARAPALLLPVRWLSRAVLAVCA